MSAAAFVSYGVLLLVLLASIGPLGRYMAKVYGSDKAPGDRFFGPVERVVYRILRVDPKREQRWNVFAMSLLAFSAVSVLALYLFQRLQASLPLSNDFPGVVPKVAFNTAISFVTNTNWQSYAGESTMGHLVQMAGLTVQNFVSAAVGMAVAMAFVRGLARRNTGELGNFWVDLVRGCVRILLPISIIGAVILIAGGAIQNVALHDQVVDTIAGAQQTIPGGPVASQEAIKELGTNG
ncbi:MAG TPA: potassium-transporting ATPase subunit KdpA, partial [Acidimicrobiales bacterium]|nr:potassium-transporting ATPase subunit KdpA [Acidimicrobiales bacterium]